MNNAFEQYYEKNLKDNKHFNIKNKKAVNENPTYNRFTL